MRSPLGFTKMINIQASRGTSSCMLLDGYPSSGGNLRLENNPPRSLTQTKSNRGIYFGLLIFSTYLYHISTFFSKLVVLDLWLLVIVYLLLIILTILDSHLHVTIPNRHPLNLLFQLLFLVLLLKLLFELLFVVLALKEILVRLLLQWRALIVANFS